MILRQPLPQRRRQQKRLLTITIDEVLSHDQNSIKPAGQTPFTRQPHEAAALPRGPPEAPDAAASRANQPSRRASTRRPSWPLADNTSHARAGVQAYRREHEPTSQARERRRHREVPDPGLDASSDGPLSGKAGSNTSFIRTRRSAITRSREGSSLRPDCSRSTAPTKARLTESVLDAHFRTKRKRSVVGAWGEDSCSVQRILQVWIVRRRRRSMTLAGRCVSSSFSIWRPGLSSSRSGSGGSIAALSRRQRSGRWQLPQPHVRQPARRRPCD